MGLIVAGTDLDPRLQMELLVARDLVLNLVVLGQVWPD